MDVVTVVVVHDSARVLPRCLGALSAAAERVDARVLVVDSGSSDDAAAVCERLGVPFMPGPNRGLGAAFNRALAREDVRRARYVLQCNPDVELPAGGLDALVALADRRPRCGILAPRQLDQHGALIHSIGVEPSAAGYWRAVRELRRDWIWDEERYEQEGRADWVMGACMLMRSEMLRAIGGFDERFFLCSEEVDLCRRARSAGWTVSYSPAVSVVHPIARRPVDVHRLRLEEWSRILYIRKWHRLRTRCSMRLAVAAHLARLVRLESAGDASTLEARTRLAASLRFNRRRYGAPPSSRAASRSA